MLACEGMPQWHVSSSLVSRGMKSPCRLRMGKISKLTMTAVNQQSTLPALINSTSKRIYGKPIWYLIKICNDIRQYRCIGIFRYVTEYLKNIWYSLFVFLIMANIMMQPTKSDKILQRFPIRSIQAVRTERLRYYSELNRYRPEVPENIWSTQDNNILATIIVLGKQPL